MIGDDNHWPGEAAEGGQESTAAAGRPGVRYALGGLLAFGALNAFGGGIYGIAGAKGVPGEWLAGNPFRDYWIPSLILFIVVGGSFLVAAVAVFARLRIARFAAFWAGATVLVWLAAETFVIGYVSWMQTATAIGGVLVLVLARLLPGPRASSARRAAAN